MKLLYSAEYLAYWSGDTDQVDQFAHKKDIYYTLLHNIIKTGREWMVHEFLLFNSDLLCISTVSL